MGSDSNFVNAKSEDHNLYTKVIKLCFNLFRYCISDDKLY